MEYGRKRKRIILKPSNSNTHFTLTLRYLILPSSFFLFIFVIASRIRVGQPLFPHPGLLVSTPTTTIRTIQSRVLFPDHVLLILPYHLNNIRFRSLDCVYRHPKSSHRLLFRPVLSADAYGDAASILRCPIPPPDYSPILHLRGNGVRYVDQAKCNQTLPNWDSVSYAVQLDGGTAVVFSKGLNLRQDRKHDPAQFTCRFGSGFSAKALTVAQEVVTCLLPPKMPEGTRVSIAMTSNPRHPRVLRILPSIAIVRNHENKRIRTGQKYEICVCTMAWNQAPSFREWVTYHAWLGVERWFIYDNSSDDDTDETIEGLRDYNVSRHAWPWIKTQEAGFSHCAVRAKVDCEWVAFIDVDEFFHFRGAPVRNSLRLLVARLSNSSEIAEIRTACHSFGPSGLRSVPERGVMAGYTCRMNNPERHKSIVRPCALDRTLLNVVHHFRLRKGFRYVNLPQNVAVINHYKYQVWGVFRAKFYRRVATYVADWGQNQNKGSKDRAPGLGTKAVEPLDWPNRFCEVWDTDLKDFVLSNMSDTVTGLLPWERHVL